MVGVKQQSVRASALFRWVHNRILVTDVSSTELKRKQLCCTAQMKTQADDLTFETL